ncbi:MAG: hypothetical protein ACIAQ0_12835 [Phycisphaerales bacterium JB058]
MAPRYDHIWYRKQESLPVRPLLAIARSIAKQDQEASFRLSARYRIRKWTKVTAILFIFMLSISSTAAVVSPSPTTIGIATLVITVFGALAAARHYFMLEYASAAEDKRTVRNQTIEHLRHTVDSFRSTDRMFVGCLLKLKSTLSAESTFPEFEDAVETWISKYLHRNYLESNKDNRNEAVRNLFASLRYSSKHSRPYINTNIVSLICDHYPLFSYIWGHLMNHEMLGAGLARKSFGIRIIDSISGPQIVDSFQHWECFIKHVRTIDGYRTAFTQFEWLASSIVMLRATRSAAKYYEIPIATDGPIDNHNIRWLELAMQSRFYPKKNRAYYRPRPTNALWPIINILAYGDVSNTKPHLANEIDEIVFYGRLNKQPNNCGTLPCPKYCSIDAVNGGVQVDPFQITNREPKLLRPADQNSTL